MPKYGTSKETKATTPKAKRNLGSSSVKVQPVRNLNNLYNGEFSALKPANIHYYLEAERGGLPFFTSELVSDIARKDLRIGSAIRRRCMGVSNKEYGLYYSNDTTVPEPVQRDTIKFLEENFAHINIPKLISRATQAQVYGIKTFQADFKLEGLKQFYDCIDPIQNSVVMFNDRTNEYMFMDTECVDGNKIRSMGWNAMTSRIAVETIAVPDISPDKIFIVEAFAGDSRNAFLNGISQSLIWAFYFKSYGLKDWSLYSERFADPAVVGKRPPVMTREDKGTFDEAIKNFGKYYRIVIPQGADLSLVGDSNKSATIDLFERYVAYWDKSIDIAINGQSLTTDIGNTGSKAAAETHYQVGTDKEIADMLSAKDFMNTVIRRLLRINGMDNVECPKFIFEEEEDVDYKLKRSEVFRNLKMAGWKVKQADVENEFDVEVEPVQSNGNMPEGLEEYIQKFITEGY